MAQVEKQDVSKTYKVLRTIDYQKASTALTDGKWKELTALKGAGGLAKAKKQDFLLMVKVARLASEQEFCDFVTAAKLPPIKLTSQEMERVKGGWAWAEVIVAVKVAAEAVCDFFEGLLG